MNDYPPEYDHEYLDNSLLAQAFPDAKGLGDLYRQIYKYTECGPWLSAQVRYTKLLEPGGYGDGYPSEAEVEEWIHSDELYRLGTWATMDRRGVLVTALMVGSIVEGCDEGTGEYELEIKHLDEEPEDLAKRFYETVEEVDAEAKAIWNDTHGCETCAKHWHEEGLIEWGRGGQNGNDGMTPVWEDCPKCNGDGIVV